MLLKPIFPILGGILLTIISAWNGWAIFPDNDHVTTITTVVQISASMMGFMLAALAILISVADKPLVLNLQKSGHYQDLLNTLFVASVIFAVAFFLSGTVLIFGVTIPYWKHFLLLLLFSGSLALLQTGWKFWLVLSNLHPHQ